MLRISEEQVTELGRRRRQGFVDAQLVRLKRRFPGATARGLGTLTETRTFIEQLVEEGAAAGISDCDNMEALLDACLAAGWTSPELRVNAGVKRILDDTWMSGTDKVTRLVNAAAFSAASPPLRA